MGSGAAGLWAEAAEARLNEVQMIGTHNSYHRAPAGAERAWLERWAPALAATLDYSHRPLAEQLGRLGVRQLELDVFVPRDEVGGACGWPVVHCPVLDRETTTATLEEALAEIWAWSRQNPQHEPVMILLELKQRTLASRLAARLTDDVERARLAAMPQPAAWSRERLLRLEQTLLAGIPRGVWFTPGDLRGGAATVAEAVRAQGWPTLDALRGRFLLALDNEDASRDLYRVIGDGERLAFVSVEETAPDAAWFKVNDPVAEFSRIRRLVAAGFLVRTRSDADLVEARAGDTRRREAAMASGAQFISTDFPEAARGSDYRVSWPDGGVWRINPVTGVKDSNDQTE